MANALLLPQNREKLARVIEPLVKDSKIIGLPAILGLYRTHEVISHLEELIGVPIFEIPTIPPSVPGLRLKEAFERGLRSKGVQYFSLTKALKVRQTAAGRFETHIGRDDVEHIIDSRGVILASGRFIGGGLFADRTHIHETIFDLPVYQPASRHDWHHRDMLDSRGHSINQAGLEIDDSFRPFNDSAQLQRTVLNRPAVPAVDREDAGCHRLAEACPGARHSPSGQRTGWRGTMVDRRDQNRLHQSPAYRVQSV